MTINDPNTNLIEAMKEKLPAKGKLADILMDTLYIGKEAVYRRLRGRGTFHTTGSSSCFKETWHIAG